MHSSTWTLLDSPEVLDIVRSMSMEFIIIIAYSIVVWKTVNSGLAIISKVMVIDFVNLALQEGILGL